MYIIYITGNITMTLNMPLSNQMENIILCLVNMFMHPNIMLIVFSLFNSLPGVLLVVLNTLQFPLIKY